MADDPLEPAQQDFLDSVKGEVALFRAVMRARPIGIHRHFHLLAIIDAIRRDTGVLVTSEQIWAKLNTLYDMDALEDLVRTLI
jgi:MRG-binding protein